jgi:hypothetical protein
MTFDAMNNTTNDRSISERYAIERWEGEGGTALPYEEPRSQPRHERSRSRRERQSSGAEARA